MGVSMKKVVLLVLIFSFIMIIMSGCGAEKEDIILKMTVPDFSGMLYDELVKDKQYKGKFVFIEKEKIGSDIYETGEVVSQDPVSGTEVIADEYPIYLTISAGGIIGTWRCEKYISEGDLIYYMSYWFLENGTYMLYYSEDEDSKFDNYLIETGDYEYYSQMDILIFKNRVRSEYAKEKFEEGNDIDYSVGCEISGKTMKLIYEDDIEIYDNVSNKENA